MWSRAEIVIAEDVPASDAVRGQDMVAGRDPVVTTVHEVATGGVICIIATHGGVDAPETKPELRDVTLGRLDGFIGADTLDVSVKEKRNGVRAVAVVEVEGLAAVIGAADKRGVALAVVAVGVLQPAMLNEIALQVWEEALGCAR